MAMLGSDKNPEKSRKLKSKLDFYFVKHRFCCQNARKKACFFCQY